MKKLPKKYAGVLFSFYASTVMVLIVSAVLVALNTGIDAGYLQRLLKSYLITWPVAFASLHLENEVQAAFQCSKPVLHYSFDNEFLYYINLFLFYRKAQP